MIPVEIRNLEELESPVAAIGSISEDDRAELGILLCPDNVIRLSNFAWSKMRPEAKKKFLMIFNAREI